MKVLRYLVPLALAAGLTACGSTGAGGIGVPIFGGGPQTYTCQTGTNVQLANPQPFQTASNVNQVTIVAENNNNTLYQTYQNWYVYLIDNYGNQIPGGQLNLVNGSNLIHPYNSDFYYASTLPQTLPAGVTYSVYLARRDQSCNALPLQSFSTQ